jgi:hypothetical protein
VSFRSAPTAPIVVSQWQASSFLGPDSHSALNPNYDLSSNAVSTVFSAKSETASVGTACEYVRVIRIGIRTSTRISEISMLSFAKSGPKPHPLHHQTSSSILPVPHSHIPHSSQHLSNLLRILPSPNHHPPTPLPLPQLLQLPTTNHNQRQHILKEIIRQTPQIPAHASKSQEFRRPSQVIEDKVESRSRFVRHVDKH